MNSNQQSIRQCANQIGIPQEFIDLLYAEDLKGIQFFLDSLSHKQMRDLQDNLVEKLVNFENCSDVFVVFFSNKLKGVMSPLSFIKKAVQKINQDLMQIDSDLFDQIQNLLINVSKKNYEQIIKDLYNSGSLTSEEINEFQVTFKKNEIISFVNRCLILRQSVIVNNLRTRFSIKRLKELANENFWDKDYL